MDRGSRIFTYNGKMKRSARFSAPSDPELFWMHQVKPEWIISFHCKVEDERTNIDGGRVSLRAKAVFHHIMILNVQVFPFSD